MHAKRPSRPILLLAMAALAASAAATAKAHDAPTGWEYPVSCCSNYDCRMITDASVREMSDGYHVPSGEVVPYSGDTRLRHSPDGEFHWCSVAGEAGDVNTICLFAPPRGM